MKSAILPATVLVSVLMLLSTPVAAEVGGKWVAHKLEFGGFGGEVHYDHARSLEGRIFGGRVGLGLGQYIGVEGQFARSSAENGPRKADIDFHHVNGFLNLARGRFVPFVNAGLAFLGGSSDDVDIESKTTFNAGGGIKLWIGNNVALRGDLSHYWSDDFAGNYVTAGDGTDLKDFHGNFGLSIGIGGGRKGPDDTDGDGIADPLDTCPDTPFGVAVDANGCPVDSDGDGVADYQDQCGDTPRSAFVDANGCPSDSDSDGVLDGIDRCGDTPAGAKVNAFGCPEDSDGDGIYDGLDQCVGTPSGIEVDEKGCPKEIMRIEEKLVLHDVRFASGSADLLPASYPRLDEVVESLKAHPDINIDVHGYTDSRGSDELNLKLSQDRAESVRNYLIGGGVAPERLRARGFGEAEPIATNDTAEGRAMNRRVELQRSN